MIESLSLEDQVNLIKKKEHLESQIIACDTMFNMMEKDNTDITVPTFLILYMIYNRQLT